MMRRRHDPLSKPPPGCEVDPGHWLFQGRAGGGVWLFHEGGGLRAENLVNHRNPGVLTSSPTWTPPGLSFSGSNYVDCGTNLVSSNRITVAARVRLNAVSGFQGVTAFMPNSDGDQFELLLSGAYLIAGAYSSQAYANPILTANKWFTLLATSNGSTIRIYIDGVDQTVQVGTQNFTASSWGGNFQVAPLRATRMAGQVDWVAVVPRFLTAGEIAAWHAEPFGCILPARRQSYSLPASAFNAGRIGQPPVLGSGVF